MRATLALMGTIIGAGVFGVPAMIGAWGIPLATAGFALVTGIVLAIHLFMAEAVIGEGRDIRLAGLAWKRLGPVGGIVGGLAQTLQVFGSNLAYLILGGEFLRIVASALGITIPLIVWQTLFWVVGSVTVIVGLKALGKVEAFLTWVLVAVMILIIAVLVGRMDWDLLLASGVGRMTFEPYGVFLFALLGMNVIPEMEHLVGGNRDDLRRAVIRGTLASAGLTYLFGISAWLASSGTLWREATGLVAILPPWLMLAVPVFGFLAVMTSYVTTAYDLGSMFRLDNHFPSWLAWTAALGVPLALLFLTERDFLRTIGLVGAVFSALAAIVAVLTGRAALRAVSRSKKSAPLAWWWREGASLAVVLLLALGGITWVLVV